MNQTFSGVVLLGAVMLIAVALFAVAYFIQPKLIKLKVIKTNVIKREISKSNNQPRHDGKRINTSYQPPARFNSWVGRFGKTSDKQLLKLQQMIVKHFKEFSVNVRQHHVVLEKNAVKVAMLTLDKGIDIGRRRLGDVIVINFHHLPNVAELQIELNGLS